MTLDPDALANHVDGAGVLAIALVGSYARGDAGPYSDVDLLRLLADDARPSRGGTHLLDSHFVNVSDLPLAESERWFSDPVAASQSIAGVRGARILRDPNGVFAALQQRARAFVWDAALQQQTNAWASQQMVGWIEEAHKGMEGLWRGDIGRMLNARHGLSWGLSHIIQVQRGLLLTGDNQFFLAVEAALGDERLIRLRRLAFGVAPIDEESPDLPTQICAGLALYVALAEALSEIWRAEDAPMIWATVERIRATLAEDALGRTFLKA